MINNGVYFFVIGSFLGWILEMTFKLLSGEKNPKAGLTNTPFCVLYGVGTFALATIIFKYTNNIFILFILSAFVLTTFEYITGLLLDKVYKIELWDYSKLRLGINKYISFEFMIVWGILGVLFIKYVLPLLNRVYVFFNNSVLIYIFYFFFIYIIFEYVYVSNKILNKKNN